MLSNIENVLIDKPGSRAYEWEFIKFVPKLRKLTIFGSAPETKQVIDLVSDLKKILSDRNNGQINGDFITLEILESHLYIFPELENICESIKLTAIPDYSNLLWLLLNR